MTRELHSLAVVVLAAGASSRMGQPKQLLRLGRHTLLEHTLEAVTRMKSSAPIFLVLGALADVIRQIPLPHNTEVVLNSHWSQGLSTSLQAGLQAARQHHPGLSGVLFVLADQPHLSAAALDAILDYRSTSPPPLRLITAHYDGHPGAPGWADASLFATIEKLSGDAGLRPLFHSLPPEQMAHVPRPELATDLDTPADYQRFIGDGAQ
jgi:molybdenum cofactor cytidylyltransferase